MGLASVTMELTLEESLIQKAIGKKLPVVIYTKNGFQMKCIIEAQDKSCIIATAADTGKTNLVYKDAISTIQFPVGNLL
jgi:RNA chaperone Hfq